MRCARDSRRSFGGAARGRFALLSLALALLVGCNDGQGPAGAEDPDPETFLVAYVVNSGASGTVSAFAVDADTGLLSPIGDPVAAGATPVFVAVSPTRSFAWVTASGSDLVYIYSIDSQTGGLTAAGLSATNAAPRSIAIDPLGRFAYITHWGADCVSKSEIDPTTGALT